MEILAGFIALLAFCAAAWQAYIANDNEKRSLRAYLGTVHPAGDLISDILPPSLPIVVLNIKNFGQTPAYKTNIVTAMGVGPYPFPDHFDVYEPNTVRPNPITVFPGMLDIGTIRIIAKRPLTSNEITGIQDGKTQRLYAYGTINYFDAFDAAHYTNFCIGFFNVTAKTVQFESCDRYNDSD